MREIVSRQSSQPSPRLLEAEKNSVRPPMNTVTPIRGLFSIGVHRRLSAAGISSPPLKERLAPSGEIPK
jgi:hypothetical protein